MRPILILISASMLVYLFSFTPPFWRVSYYVIPPIIRILEYLNFHSGRQEFLIGHLNKQKTPDDLKKYLIVRNYSPAILAWRENNEILSLKLNTNDKFQYHIRLFDDGEIRGHYEWASEANPIGHIFETVFESKSEYFRDLLGDFLGPTLE